MAQIEAWNQRFWEEGEKNSAIVQLDGDINDLKHGRVRDVKLLIIEMNLTTALRQIVNAQGDRQAEEKMRASLAKTVSFIMDDNPFGLAESHVHTALLKLCKGSIASACGVREQVSGIVIVDFVGA